MAGDSFEIRAILSRDPSWCLYALGDLDPREYPLCDWRLKRSQGDAVILLYHGFAVPVLFAFGAPADVEELLNSKPLPAEVYLHLRPDITPICRTYYQRLDTNRMVRMIFRGDVGLPTTGVRRLEDSNIPALIDLYDVRRSGGEDTVFFDPTMVSRGCYYGVRDEDQLVAAAGTHLVNEAESVAGVGNIFCHPGFRGKGLGRAVTTAVVKELSDRDISTIGLNVDARNEAARGLYRSLGFVEYCDYEEGFARRSSR
jgi:GNAT superfamily N-acetyltransferase